MLRNVLVFVLRLSLGLAVIFATGCRAKKKETPVVGVILAISGPADFIGKPERDVLNGLMKEYDSNKALPSQIELRILGSESKPDIARAMFDSLVEDSRVIAIIGPSTSGESIPLAKEAGKKKIPLLSLAASKKIVEDNGEVNKWAFKFAQNDDLAAEKLAGVISRKGDTEIALLYSNDSFGKSGMEMFKKAAQGFKIKVIRDVPFPTGLDAPEAYADAIPEQVQGIVIWGTTGPDTLVKEIRRRGSKARIYLSHGNASDSFIKSTGVAAEGVILIGSRLLTDDMQLSQESPGDKTIMQYRAFWKAKFGGVPSHFGGHARDALDAIMTVLPKINLSQEIEDVRSDVRDEIEGLNPFYGVTGTFRFDPNDHAGLRLDAFATYEIKNGKFVLDDK